MNEFVLASALERAEQTPLERQRFDLDAGRWMAFMAELDAPPRELPRLRRLFAETSPFESPGPE